VDRALSPSVPRFRLLALDHDGTLLDSRKRLSPRTREAVAGALRLGVRVAVVTGRRCPATRPYADELGPGVLLVLHNGALIVDDGAVVLSRPLPRAVARAALAVGRELGAEAVLHCGPGGEGRVLAEPDAWRNPLLARYLASAGSHTEQVGSLEAVLEREDPMQVMFGGGTDAMEALAPVLGRRLGAAARVERTAYGRLGIAILDVLEPSVGKARAVRFLQGRLGVSAAETLAVGDNWNDREMLEQAGLGLVMANADPELLDLGFPQAPANDEDGVAHVLESLLLGSGAGPA
jgi:hypothetical protein